MIVMAAAAGLGACATAPLPVAQPASHFDDAIVGPPTVLVRAEDALALSPELKQFIEDRLRPRSGDWREARVRLIDALNRPGELRLVYDDSHTRTASEAFAHRRGNCLSLALLTARVAKELGLPVSFQQVAIDELWSRQNGFTFVSGHVNVVLPPPAWSSLKTVFDRTYTVDFVPSEQVRGLKTRELSEQRVIAMLLNNRAAESLAAGDTPTAYHWLRESLRVDPGFAAAYNTLGIVWHHLGHVHRASRAYEQALALDGDNVKFLGNWLIVLQALGETQRSAEVSARLERLLPSVPLYWYDQGQLALDAGDPARALELFRRELKRDPQYHAVHRAMAEALMALGRADEARVHLQSALRESTRSEDSSRYEAKLAKLELLRAPNKP